MNYLTNHYKNLCEQYKNKISILENLLNEDAPASTFSGTGQGQQTFSDQQLRDQMKQNRRTGLFGAEVADDKQNQAFKDAQAELARREGKGSVKLVNTSKPGESPRVDLDPSIKQSSDVKTDRVAGDWVERWANKLGEDPRKIEAMRRGVIDTLGGDAGKPMDTSMTSDQVAQSGVDAYNKAKEYVLGLQNQAKASAPNTAPKTKPGPKETNKENNARQNYIDQIGDSLDNDGSRTIVEPERKERGFGIEVEHGQHPIYPERQEDSSYGKPREGPGSAVGDAQNALVNAAGKLVSDKAKDVSDFLKKNLMTFNPYPKQPLEMKIGPTRHTSPTYVVPESEAWSNMSPEEQRAMALAALGRNEVHKFFGGREVIIDGKRTGRFSEDNSGQTPEETARLNRQAKMLNKFLYDYDVRKTQEADREWEEGEKEWNKAKAEGRIPGQNDEDTNKQSSSAGALESSRQLAQMYANRMGRRVSKAPATTETPAAPKEQISSFESDFKTWQDRNARTRQMSLAMAEKQSPKGSNMEGQALENDAMARARYAQSVKTNATQKAAEQEFVKRFGRLPNSKSAVDNTYMETLLSTKFKTK